MKKTSQGLIAALAILFAAATQVFAIEGLKLQIRCPDVVLSWPSTNDETYLVQYRATLDTNSDWQTLTNYMPPATGTNLTAFVHSNRVDCPAGQVFGMMLASGGANAMMTTVASSLSVEEQTALKLAREEARLNALYEKCKLEGREPYDWELKNQPPLPLSPEEVRARILKARTNGAATVSSASVAGITLDGPSVAGGVNGPQPADAGLTPSTGFYRVVRNGAHLVGITNGMTLSGVVTIPVEVGNDLGSLVNLSIVEDGSPVSDISIELSPFSGPLQVPVDTTQMANGTHDIFAHAVWQVTTGTNEQDTYFVEADSPPVTANVYNEISFTNWMPSFGELGNSLLISAQSAHADTDWLIDIYGANAGYIGTFSGHTYDGSIYGTWDLTGPPPDYIQYTNEPWFQFKVSTPYIDPPSPKTYKQTDPWAGRGDWVMAAQHAWDNVSGHEDLYNELDGYVGFAQGVGLTVRPNPDSDGHAFTLHVADQSDPQPTSDWASLRQALYHSYSRNFIYLGHGCGDGIGVNSAHTNRFISATEIASVLHTIPAGQTNRHAFRMVILDGCSTATGTLPEAFGIPHKQGMTDQDFLFAAMRPCAYVGWSADKYISIQSGGLNYDHIHFIQHISEGMLLNELGIKAAIDYARTRSDVNDAFVYGNQFKVFGDQELGINAYNQ